MIKYSSYFVVVVLILFIYFISHVGFEPTESFQAKWDLCVTVLFNKRIYRIFLYIGCRIITLYHQSFIYMMIELSEVHVDSISSK